MKLRNLLILVLCTTLLCGCNSILPANGTLDIKTDDVDHIEVMNGLTGDSFTVSDREDIRKLVDHINSFTLEGGAEPATGNAYTLRLLASDGSKLLTFAVNADRVNADGRDYPVDAQDLLRSVEALECDTMTDSELIDSLLTGDTLNRLSVIDEDGKISLDKIAGLTASCPALFELLSRPSAITSVGSYGLEAIQTALESSDINLRERAEALAQIVKEYLPDFSGQIDQLLGK